MKLNKKYIGLVIYMGLVFAWAMRFLYFEIRNNTSVKLTGASLDDLNTNINFTVFNGTNFNFVLHAFRIYVYDFTSESVVFVTDPKRMVIAQGLNSNSINVGVFDAVSIVLNLIGGTISSNLGAFYEFKFLNLITIRGSI